MAAALGIAATLALGQWQWSRAQQKLGLEAAIRARESEPSLDAGQLARADPGDLLHRRVQLRGQWVAQHTVFLDNRQMQGRPGFYVVTPLRLSGADAVVLVQRGWVPRNFVERERLPPVQTPPGEVTVGGRIAPPPAKLYEFAEAPGGPIRQNLDLPAFRAETGLPLMAVSVQQTGKASEGLLRDWPQPAGTAGKNLGYAFQWWALCALIFILYVWFQFIAPRRRRPRSA
ncbi:SURF1 family protein [Ramlibacter aurantiacus]|uniref:SURF1 family protein n=1 Tax=Ramlibacter aurantiacus TaxID=2801330 RepID=UPI001F337E13|nr:SURF1 family protein [Ramlibacter aurantiacus]